MSLDFDVNCTCGCPGDAPNGGARLITFRNVQPADLIHYRALAKVGAYTAIECPDCGCHQRLDDDGLKVVTISTAMPQISGIGPNQGLSAGGNDVNIYGHALDDPSLVVKFGGVAATIIRKTDEMAALRTPAATQNGRVDVTVEGTHGHYPVKGVLVGGYIYVG